MADIVQIAVLCGGLFSAHLTLAVQAGRDPLAPPQFFSPAQAVTLHCTSYSHISSRQLGPHTHAASLEMDTGECIIVSLYQCISVSVYQSDS